MGHGRLEEDVFIWETTDGRIAAVLNREGPGNAFLQVHPGLLAKIRDLGLPLLSVKRVEAASPTEE